ncbi:MAG TPA: formate dehydrogenase subunit gamma [Rhodospirillales bacterium]|nr:formate dehydrogenase subunit gamma [Rhodospirillales bacterium]
MDKRQTFKRLSLLACFSLVLVWSFSATLAGSLDLRSNAYAQTGGAVPGKTLGNKNDADIWRQLRRGDSFNLSGTATGTQVLIQSPGEEWRSLRNGPLSYWGGVLILASTLAIIGFFIIYGRIKIEGGRSGRTISRFTKVERWSHWSAAILFVLLGVTGLFVMFGRYVIAPIVGKGAWSVIAGACLEIHNVMGPLFVVSLVVLLAVYMKDNVWQKGDLSWVLKGAFFSDTPPLSWKYNLGEKSWYWLLFFAGIAISGSGLLLDFPWLAERVQQLQLAHLIHGGAAVILIAASLGHIYLGTIGVEGAYEGMADGTVDENWAREHHGWWANGVMENPDSDIDRDGQATRSNELPAE